MPSADRSLLVRLAHAHGIATTFWDWTGQERTVPETTVRAALTALGVAVADDAAVHRALAEVGLSGWRRVLPPVIVLRQGWTPWVPVHVPDGTEVLARLHLEDGELLDLGLADHWVQPREVDGVLTGEVTVELPGDVPLGYHRLEVDYTDRTASTTVIVTPATLRMPQTLRTDRAWGLLTQLYAVRSDRSWGIGDAADLAELGTWAAREGADFVLVNPVHAAEPVPPMEPSPYLPATRRFVNPMYIRVEEVPEIGYLSPVEHQLVERHSDEARRLNQLDRLDRDSSWQSKQAALRIIFRTEWTHRRRRAFEEFRAREGQGLVDYATWCAIVVDRGLPWTDWPAGLQDPRSAAVETERERLAGEVEFHCWLQWVVQAQFRDAQRELHAAGMRVGVMHDLAVGCHPGGSDAWAMPDVLAEGFSVGAPPDDYNQRGQDWSQPPWRPDRLAELGYAPYRDMVRTTLRMAGAIRVDHIIGLFRLWWVPQGRPATEGTYVRYDHEALVGILALEAHRAGALVIGEDLGTVEDWVRDYLAERGVLGTSILWFEREPDGTPRAPETYRELCLASVTTHDLPPTAGYLQGEHVTVRHELGLLGRPLDVELRDDQKHRDAVLGTLRSRGLLGAAASIEDQIGALHRFLAGSPSRLLGVSLSDLAGDERTINQPGTDEEYPNWRFPLAGPDNAALTLDELIVSRRAERLIRCVTSR